MIEPFRINSDLITWHQHEQVIVPVVTHSDLIEFAATHAGSATAHQASRVLGAVYRAIIWDGWDGGYWHGDINGGIRAHQLPDLVGVLTQDRAPHIQGLGATSIDLLSQYAQELVIKPASLEK